MIFPFPSAQFAAEAPFTPKSVAGLLLWLDASDASTITQSSGLISQWDDKSGAAYNATQPTGSARPTYTTGAQNGLNVATFDGSSTFFDCPAVAGQATVIVVGKMNGSSGQSFLEASPDRTVNTLWAILAEGGNLKGRRTINGNQYDAAYAYANGAYYMHTFFANSSSGAIYQNATSEATSAASGPLPTGAGISIGALYVSGETRQYFLDGTIAELLIYSGTVGNTDFAGLQAYCGSKWGLGF